MPGPSKNVLQPLANDSRPDKSPVRHVGLSKLRDRLHEVHCTSTVEFATFGEKSHIRLRPAQLLHALDHVAVRDCNARAGLTVDHDEAHIAQAGEGVPREARSAPRRRSWRRRRR